MLSPCGCHSTCGGEISCGRIIELRTIVVTSDAPFTDSAGNQHLPVSEKGGSVRHSGDHHGTRKTERSPGWVISLCAGKITPIGSSSNQDFPVREKGCRGKLPSLIHLFRCSKGSARRIVYFGAGKINAIVAGSSVSAGDQ